MIIGGNTEHDIVNIKNKKSVKKTFINDCKIGFKPKLKGNKGYVKNN